MKNAHREIIGLAILLDELSSYQVFVDYSGNIKLLEVRVFADENRKEKMLYENFYYDFRFSDDEKNYNKIKSFLQDEINKLTTISGGN